MVCATERLDPRRPDFVVIENVDGSDEYRGGVWQFMLRSMLLLSGYQCRSCILNASRFLTPSSRSRVIAIAARADRVLPPSPRPLNLPGVMRIGTQVDNGSSKVDRDHRMVKDEARLPRICAYPSRAPPVHVLLS